MRYQHQAWYLLFCRRLNCALLLGLHQWAARRMSRAVLQSSMPVTQDALKTVYS
jgi:hypothetical protein